MSQRLVDTFAVGTEVEISFAHSERWWPGVVVAHEHPGVWVRTANGRVWFVTNRQRIRSRLPGEAPA